MVCFFYPNKDYQIKFSGNYLAMMDEYNSTFSPSLETKDWLCYKSEDKTHARDPTKGLDLAMESKGKDRVGLQLVKSFSLVSNTNSLLATKSGTGHLDSMNGMKFISMTWVILGHTFLQCLQLTSITARNVLPTFTLLSGSQGIA